MTAVVTISAVLMLGLGALYLLRYRDHPVDVWSPPAAWLRAGVYFCFCLVVAAISGALEATLSSPLAQSSQLGNIWWWLATVGVTVFIVAAYWVYWYRNTLRFGRRLQFFSQGLFGLAWGFTTGLYFLSFWHFALWLGPQWPTWATWLVAYTLISFWQALWMDMYWDVWVSPEHDTPESIKRKVPRTHIPNMTLCLTHFALFSNYWLFILWQTIALLAASYGMRMPPPWSRLSTPPARQVSGLMGLPRAGGYVAENVVEN